MRPEKELESSVTFPAREKEWIQENKNNDLHSSEGGNLMNFLLFVCMFIVGILLLGNLVEKTNVISAKIKTVVVAINILVVFAGMFLLPAPKFSSPTKNFVKVIQAMAFAYFINLTILVLLDAESVKAVLTFIDPHLAFPLPERSYAVDCRIYTPENPASKFNNIRETLDIFVASHFVGWMVKTLIFRNNLLTWFLSIIFEVYELSLKHWLPNFCECWWDHIFLDLFGCNLLGILMGNFVIKRFKLENFHWFFEPTERSEKMPYLRRFWFSLTEVTPFVKSHRWHWLASPENFLTVSWLIALNSIIDLSNFFNKTMLNIPPNHYLLAIRVWILGLYSLVVVHDIYSYTHALKAKKKISFSIYLSHLILVLEVILFCRNYNSRHFQASTPIPVIIFWLFALFSWVSLLLLSVRNSKRKFFKN